MAFKRRKDLRRNFLIVLACFMIFGLPAFSYKDIAPVRIGEPQKVEITNIDSAVEMLVNIGRMRTIVYVSNLDCGEYSRTYTLKSTKGHTYVRPRSHTVRISSEPTNYIFNIFKQNKDNTYFVTNGLGLFANPVGEFYIGEESINKHLIEKGYCRYVE